MPFETFLLTFSIGLSQQKFSLIITPKVFFEFVFVCRPLDIYLR